MSSQKTMDIRQKIIAASTSRGWSAPHAAYIHEADVTNLLLWLSKINETPVPSKITLNTLLVYLMVSAIKSCPAVNAHIHYNKWLASGSVTLIDRIDVNMPVILPDGKMMTLKLSSFENKTIREMQDCINTMMKKIRNTDMDAALMKTALHDTLQLLKKGDVIRPLGRLIGLKIGKSRIKKIPKAAKETYAALPEKERINIHDIDMGTVTISNMGAALKNTKGFPALIDVISPQVFAVGIGPIYDEPSIYENNKQNPGIVFRKKTGFCLVFDHRALDFGDIIPFIKKIDTVCNEPELYIE